MCDSSDTFLQLFWDIGHKKSGYVTFSLRGASSVQLHLNYTSV